MPLRLWPTATVALPLDRLKGVDLASVRQSCWPLALTPLILLRDRSCWLLRCYHLVPELLQTVDAARAAAAGPVAAETAQTSWVGHPESIDPKLRAEEAQLVRPPNAKQHTLIYERVPLGFAHALDSFRAPGKGAGPPDGASHLQKIATERARGPRKRGPLDGVALLQRVATERTRSQTYPER